MDVIDAEQARIAEEAGACAVMALERVPADIRKNGKYQKMLRTSLNCIISFVVSRFKVALLVCLIPR